MGGQMNERRDAARMLVDAHVPDREAVIPVERARREALATFGRYAAAAATAVALLNADAANSYGPQGRPFTPPGPPPSVRPVRPPRPRG